LREKLEKDLQAKEQTVSVIQKRIASFEDLFETQRKELFSNLTQVEKEQGKRADTLSRAIHDMARELKVTNPLLLY